MENTNKKYFETIKCNDYEIFNLDYHCKRIANTIGLNINLQDYIYPPSNKLLKCKVIYDDCEILDVEYSEYKKREIKTFKLIYDDEISYDKKALHRNEIDALSLKKQSCDEIIIVKNGIVSDTSIANIAVFYQNKWLTSKQCLLKGTTRDRYINESTLVLEDITVEILKGSTKLALLNAMIDFDILKDYSFLE